MANNSIIPPPSYDDIFSPPKRSHREVGKSYGKTLLEKCFKSQHQVLLENYRCVRSWFKDFTCTDDLRHKSKEQERIKQIIVENNQAIKELKFEGVHYNWKANDIYEWWIASNQSKRKYAKLKTSKQICHSFSLSDPQNTGGVMESKEKIDHAPPLVAKDTENDNMETEHEQIYALYKAFEDANPVSMKTCALSDPQNIGGIMESQEKIDHAPPLVAKDTENDNMDTKTCASIEEYTDDVLYGTQFPFGFTQLLATSLQTKKVQADVSTSDMDVDIMGNANLLESGVIRKSKRERKVSEKMKEIVEECTKKTKTAKKTKYIKDVNKHVATMKKNDSNDVLIYIEDKETILLKYFDLKTIEDMYMVLKASYAKIIRDEDSCLEFQKNMSVDEMRDNIVDWLFETHKVLLHRCEEHELTLDEVELLA